MYNLDEIRSRIENAVLNSNSMREAASKASLHFNTFKKYALLLGIYHTNQSGRGSKKIRKKIPLEDIFNGLHPEFHTFKLGLRILDENIKPRMCENCLRKRWNNQPIPLELDHINGNSYDHRLENLRFLCPNCHAQTPTHRGRNKYK